MRRFPKPLALLTRLSYASDRIPGLAGSSYLLDGQPSQSKPWYTERRFFIPFEISEDCVQYNNALGIVALPF